MRNSDLLKIAIDDGLEGKNLGLSMGSSKLNALTGGLQYGRYDLVGGTTGSSKTAFVDNFYVLKPWFALREARRQGLTKRTMKVFYWSLEIRKTHKLAKWLAWIIFQKYKILIDSKYILTMLADDELIQKNRMSTEIYELIMQELDVLDEMEDDIFIIDNKITPKGIYASVKQYADNNGITSTVPIMDRKGNFIYNKDIYKANDPEELVLGIVDHLGLVSPNKEETGKKGTIDTLSSFFVSLRNQHNYSFCAVSQFNRELADVTRQRFKELTPQMEDFKDTGGPSEDAETVIALFNPIVYNMNTYSGYNIGRLGERFRGVSILKNRNGSAPARIGYTFLGECGAYAQLPKGDEMQAENYEFSLKEWPKDVRIEDTTQI